MTVAVMSPPSVMVIGENEREAVYLELFPLTVETVVGESLTMTSLPLVQVISTDTSILST